ncbi:hypothetical protein EG68_06216 [Paragonimus skrjabini miyazakii]|uniref:Saposin B-type domain-containing protein n=1 Tax=Paragonimus skrjabini miyazakii TaxID=59628 RepID=A0A8S9YVB9_9TREM|nr:hypothetical protein EG68_06216 [Paragonimus skrjabini miyazakii]
MLVQVILFSMLMVGSLGQEYGDTSDFVCYACENVMELIKLHLMSDDTRKFVEEDLVKLCHLIPAPEIASGCSTFVTEALDAYIARVGKEINVHQSCVVSVTILVYDCNEHVQGISLSADCVWYDMFKFCGLLRK